MGKRTGSPSVAVGYVRVSTEDQNLGPQAQRAALDAWATRTGVALVVVFEDHGVSGAAAIADRPGLVAALAALREHGAGVFVAAKRDRIARDPVVAAMVERAAWGPGPSSCPRTGRATRWGPRGP